ncbi:EAL domain-containing protein [uncultured Thiodictyon sp.]|uniref:EAL domain-containing protein n=1 Tax=uncultured Thiodictyon sp. TaxID=1846217 RepID=UPI0025EFB6CC|nr:EAL domain-containing protein [uncultured Thiodictyon sp.]
MPSLADQPDHIVAALLAALRSEAVRATDPMRIVHELQVHQLELELQNRELRAAQQALEESRDRYADLYDFAPVAYATVTRAGRITQMNLTAAHLLGTERILVPDLVLGTWLAPGDWPTLLASLARVLEYGEEASIEVGLEHPPQPRRDLHLIIQPERPHPRGEYPAACRMVLLDITATKQAEAALRRSEAKFRTLFEATTDALMLLDAQRFLDCNQATLTLFGCATREAFCTCHPADVSPPQQPCGTASIALANQHIAFAMQHGHCRFEWMHQRADNGQPFIAEVLLNAMTLDGKVVLLANVHDIAERKRTEDKLRLAASVFTHAWEAIMIIATDGTIIDVNDAFTRITSYTRAEVVGRPPSLFGAGRRGTAFYTALWCTLVEQGRWSGEVWNRRKDGEVYVVMKTISAVRDDQGHPRQYVALFSDITQLKAQERQLRRMAHYDALTHLPNRVLLADRLRQAMAQAQRHRRLLAVVFLDLDGFKAINDAHGHAAGDQLLIAAATGMQGGLRAGDTLARIGGDEFVAVLLDLADRTVSAPLLARLVAAAAQAVPIGEHLLQVSASVGVTFYPQADEIDAEQLLRQADQAMYQAKQEGKNRYHIFDADSDRLVREHHECLGRLRQALTAGECVLYYQPQVNMRTGTVIGAEALLRWQHPQRGLLLPTDFLPESEGHPLAVELGDWVIAAALTQIEQWRATGLVLPISVNVGARALQQADFVTRLRERLAAHPTVLPGDLQLEVLESCAPGDLARAAQVIEACTGLGIPCALDNFGVGYASLIYLKRLPVARIKIDRSFVHDMLDDPDDLKILEGVLGLAATFGRQVIAEGVESTAQGELLLQLGCELAQGHCIAHPMPAAELPGWAAAWRPAPAWVDLPAVRHRDLPLLCAGTEHRAWVIALESHLNGTRETPPPLDRHQCQLGRWLDGDGLHHYGAQPCFQVMAPLHEQLHALAVQLCALHAEGRDPEALARRDELHALRAALLAQLQQLTKAGALHPPPDQAP